MREKQRHREQRKRNKFIQDSSRKKIPIEKVEEKEIETISKMSNLPQDAETIKSQTLGLYFRAFTKQGDESYNEADVKNILKAIVGKGYPIEATTIKNIVRAVRQARTPPALEPAFNMGNDEIFRWGIRVNMTRPVEFHIGHGVWTRQGQEPIPPMTATFMVNPQQNMAAPSAHPARPNPEAPTPVAADGYTQASVGTKQTAGHSYAIAAAKPPQGAARERREKTPGEMAHMTRQLKTAAVSGGVQKEGVAVTVVCGPPMGVGRLFKMATYFGLPESLLEAENQALMAMQRSIVKLMKSKGWDDKDIKAVEGRLYLHWEANTRAAPPKGQPKGGGRNSGALRHGACRVRKVDLGSEDGAEDEMVVAIKRAIFLNGEASRQFVEVAEGGVNIWATQGRILLHRSTGKERITSGCPQTVPRANEHSGKANGGYSTRSTQTPREGPVRGGRGERGGHPTGRTPRKKDVHNRKFQGRGS
jgi:hypothetical protein